MNPAIMLVAGRELRVRLTSRVFLVATGLMVLGIIAGGVLYAVFVSDDDGDADPVPVGVTQEAADFGNALEAIPAETGDPYEVTVVDRDEGEAMVAEGDVDVLIDGPIEAMEFVVDSDLGQSLELALRSIAEQQLLGQQITDLGGDPEEVAQSLAASQPEIVTLDEDGGQSPAQVGAGFIVGILLFVSILSGGTRVAAGVVEEKTSRVVELLLATMRPTQLLAGKVIGNILVGLVEIGVIVLTAVAVVWTFGIVDPEHLNIGVTAISVLAWFLVGFSTYALILAGASSTVSRQEEVGSVTGPVTALMMVPYVLGLTLAVWDPGNTIVQVSSYVPGFAPFIMPILSAQGVASTTEVMVSLGISIAVIPLLCVLAATLYKNSILRTGARVSLREALTRSR